MPYSSDLLKVKQTGYSLSAGRVLISAPYYNDAFFNRSVVLLTDYGAEHCAGLILNHKLPYKVNELVDELKVESPMFLDIPVQFQRLVLGQDADRTDSGITAVT